MSVLNIVNRYLTSQGLSHHFDLTKQLVRLSMLLGWQFSRSLVNLKYKSLFYLVSKLVNEKIIIRIIPFV